MPIDDISTLTKSTTIDKNPRLSSAFKKGRRSETTAILLHNLELYPYLYSDVFLLAVVKQKNAAESLAELGTSAEIPESPRVSIITIECHLKYQILEVNT